MLAYLPAAVLATGLVTVAPVLLIEALAPHRSLAAKAIAGPVAALLSLPVAAAAAALWRRQPWSRDVVFGDLLLWAWVRRYLTERRLAHTLDLYQCAKRAGPAVSIELLTGIARLLGARDPYTHGHGQRVARNAERIARAMRLPPAETAKVCAAAAVHDVGKLFTPRTILNKPGRLTAAELNRVKQHAADGAEMLEGVGDPEIAAMVRHHHERIDGRGYPDGLAGSQIPLGARIIAVADTFDAVVSNRAYRGACTQKQALELISQAAGTQLDSVAVAAFRDRYGDRRPFALTALASAGAQRAFVALQTVAQGVGGVAPLLPALGAAGVLGLSSSSHSHPTQPTPARPGAAAPASRQADLAAARGRQTGPTLSAPRRGQAQRPRARSSPPQGTPRRNARVAPKAPAGATGAADLRPGAAGGSPPPAKAGPTLPALPPAVREVAPVPPVSPEPPVPPEPPAPPPLQVPSVPSLSVPSVPIAPAPSLPVPPPPVRSPVLPT